MKIMVTYSLDVNIQNPNIKANIISTKWNTYKVLNYEKTLVRCDDTETMKYKSVIIDAKTNVIYSFSPPKSITFEAFMESNPDVKCQDIMITEIIPGIMINLWFDCFTKRWEISSREGIELMDYEMEAFMIAFGCDPTVTDINMDPFLRQFSYGDQIFYNYSFVLNITYSTPRLFLIARYKIENNNVIDETENFDLFQKPYTYNFPTYRDMQTHFKTIQGSYLVAGAMLYNKKTGQRTKLFNQAYLDYMEIRYTDACILYQYLTLRYVNKMQPNFEKYAKLVTKFIQNLLDSYKARYVMRTGEIISNRYMPIVYKLHHNIYLPSLQKPGSKTVVTKEVITNYLNRIDL